MAPEISIISGPKAWRMAGTAAPPAAVTAREMRSASMMGSPSSRKMSAAVLFPEPAPPVKPKIQHICISEFDCLLAERIKKKAPSLMEQRLSKSWSG